MERRRRVTPISGKARQSLPLRSGQVVDIRHGRTAVGISAAAQNWCSRPSRCVMIRRMSSSTMDPGEQGAGTKFGQGGGGRPFSSSGGGWEMNELRILEHARQLAAGRGYELGSDYATAFLQALRTRDIARDWLHSEAEALDATNRLVNASIDLSGSTTVLSANVFREVLSSFCPFWPFCR